jgi:hypothetical protein
MKYTVGQLQDIARQGGWPEDLIVTIAAIGMGESSGDPNARNPNLARENSIGLWQVNRYAWPQYSEADLRDPIYNAQAAFAIYQRQGFRAWGAYSNGSYKRFLPASQAAYQGGGAPSYLDDQGFDVSTLGDQLLQPFESLGSGDSSSLLTFAVCAVAGILFLDWFTS